MEEDTATPVYPRLEPHHSFWKASPEETAGSRGVTPLGLPSGMLTYDNTQGEGMAGVGGVAMAGTIPPAAAGEPPTTVSNWKESGLVAAF